MYKFSKIIAWAYLVVGFVFVIEIFANWNTDRQKSYLSILMAILAFFMFFFKRKFKNRHMQKH